MDAITAVVRNLVRDAHVGGKTMLLEGKLVCQCHAGGTSSCYVEKAFLIVLPLRSLATEGKATQKKHAMPISLIAIQ